MNRFFVGTVKNKLANGHKGRKHRPVDEREIQNF
jgi:hypothetical protein